MTTRIRLRAGAVLAAAGALVLSACGGLTESTDGGEEITKLAVTVPADPGGGWDQTARLGLQKVLEGEEIVPDVRVTNVPGAGGATGLAKLVSTKEPNSLMVMGFVMVGALEINKAKNTLDEVTPIARLTEESEIIAVPKESPYDTVQDLLDDAKANGRDVTFTGGSQGGADHILAALMYQAGGVDVADLNYIPYSGGGESSTGLLGNKYDAGISGVGEWAELVKSGKLKALAVSGSERSELLPDVPTLKEAGVDVELTNWRGVVAPGSISDDKADALTELVTEMAETDAWATVLKDNGWADAFLAGEEFGDFLDEQVKITHDTLVNSGLVKDE